MRRKLAQGIKTQHSDPNRGFTLIELLAVIGTVCLLACFMVPALARARIKGPSAGCLSNLRQMQLGSTMYRDDNSDFLMPNAPGGEVGWVQRTEDWHTAPANIDATIYASAHLWPYINGDVSVFRCPADFIPSDNGYRLRSYSMNGQMGLNPIDSAGTFNPGWRTYYKGSDLTCPTPANAWILCDESMYTLNDGYLQLDANGHTFADAPAAYHAGGCGFSFADGHSEIHRWQGPNLIAVPYAYNVVNDGVHVASGLQDPDWSWLIQHGTCHQ